MSFNKWQNLEITFAEIKQATKNFEKCIGTGGYGLVYYGELSKHGKHTKVAVKRLNEKFGQGLKEFLTEIELLSNQEHENLISLLGYCDEGKEKILVYEYAQRGSFDQYILHRTLTWIERLKICVQAARGLDHLHNHAGEHQTIIHRDIKSANILIDEDWVAKISDLGLSKLSLAALDRSSIVSYACGTAAYCEPEYVSSGIVKKESDVYSFGVVLFEVLCGRLCNTKYKDGFVFSAKLAKEYYEKDKLDEIVDPSLKTQMSSASMEKFSTMAYRCLQDDREHRPPMDIVTKELEDSLKIQEEYEAEMEERSKSLTRVEFDTEEYWKRKLPWDIEDIIKRLDSPPSYSGSRDLFKLLRKGVLFDHGLRVFSITKDGIKCEKLLSKAFIIWKKRESGRAGLSPGRGDHHYYKPRFEYGSKGTFPHIKDLNVSCKISTSMLSLGIMYAARLIFSFAMRHDGDSVHKSPHWVWIKWQSQDLCVSSAHFVEDVEQDEHISGSVWKTTLWHFFNNDKNAYFSIVINRILGSREMDLPYVRIHGIEFQPVDMKKDHYGIEGLEGVSISDKQTDWVKNIPSDYQGIIDRMDTQLEYTTQEELYFLLCSGILIDSGRKWFSICKTTGGKCLMLSAIEILSSDTDSKYIDSLSLSESRFKEVIRLHNSCTVFGFKFILESDFLSLSKSYYCYLVFKFLYGYKSVQDECILEASVKMNDTETKTYAHLKLHEPRNIPVVMATKKIKFHDSWNAPKTKGSLLPKKCIDGKDNYLALKRNDGWMEVVLFKLLSHSNKPLEVMLTCGEGPNLNGLIVQGIEFRPI